MAEEKKETKVKAAVKPEPEQLETPSGLALAKVGADGDGEEYLAEKRKHRWGL